MGTNRRRWWAVPAVALFIAGLCVGVPQARAGGNFDLRLLRVFNRVVLLVKEQYVDRTRIDPRKMFLKALEHVENRVPEVLIESPPVTRQGREVDAVGVVVGDAREDFYLDDLTSVWHIGFKLRSVFSFLDARISSDVERPEIEYAAVNGMLSTLDPHSVLLEPRSSEEMKLSTKGEFGGLGIVISIRDDWLTVISPIDGTPADRAGIQALDRIVKIGEESTVNMALDEAVERLRGRKGTKVVIWITRKGMDEPKKIVITRATIRVQSVTHHLLDDKVGYIKLKQFQGRTSEDVKKAVDEMRAEAGAELTGLILDLRNNPGGLLDQSIKVSNLFLDDGVIVVTQEGGTRGQRQEVKAFSEPGKIGVPLVVLVNGGSASASEIVSGAMKNRGRGLIVGDQTFGKGSVQQLYDFPDGSSLKLTIGQYLTPGDESIQSVGITPDVIVRPMLAESTESVNLFPDTMAREEDLASHLDDSRIKKRVADLECAYLSEPLEEGERQRRETSSKFHDDFEIRFAARVLTSPNANATRTGLLDVARGVVDKVHNEQDKKILEKLKKLGVDWTPGANEKSAGLELSVVGGPPSVIAGDKLKLTVEAKNVGTTPLHQIKGISASTLWYFTDREFLFGHLAPGEKRQWTMTVKLPKDISARHDLMRIGVTDSSDTKLASLDVPIDVKGVQRPRFSYASFVDDAAKGNGDGLLQVGETVDLVVAVNNNGQGTAESPIALLKNEGGAEVFIATGRQTVKALAPGASGHIRFKFDVRKKADEAKLKLQVYDSVMGDYLVETLTFPIGAKVADEKKRSPKTVQVSRENAAIYAAADGTASVIARAEQGAILPTVGEVGSFWRVKIGKQLYGFVGHDTAGPTSGRPVTDAKGVPKGLSAVFGRDPPRITIEGVNPDAPLTTTSDTFTFDVQVSDDDAVRDVYVFVRDKKTFYRRLKGDGPTEVSIPVTATLDPGVNLITVVAREDDEFAQRQVFSVYSSHKDPIDNKRKIERH